MLFIFSTLVFIRHLWQLKTVCFLQWCLICAVLLGPLCCIDIMSIASAECQNLAHYAEGCGTPMGISRNTICTGRLSTVDLLIKADWFVKQ